MTGAKPPEAERFEEFAHLQKAQKATWYGRRPRPGRHCVKWGPSSPHGKRHSSPHFLADVYCGQLVDWSTISATAELLFHKTCSKQSLFAGSLRAIGLGVRVCNDRVTSLIRFLTCGIAHREIYSQSFHTLAAENGNICGKAVRSFAVLDVARRTIRHK